MRYKIYICITITVIYIQLYRQSNRIEVIKGKEEKQKSTPNQSMGMETDKYIQERAIDSTNRYIQPNKTSWQHSLINERYMYYRYVQPMQYNQYGYSVQSACPIEQDNIYNPYYSTNTSYNRNISRKRARTEQNPSSVHNLDTNNSMNTALDMRVPYNSRRAKQSSIDIAIAGASADNAEISKDTDNLLDMRVPYNSRRAEQSSIDRAIASTSADSDTDSDSADALMDIKSIKEYIHIEEEYIVINMYIFCKIRNLAILKKEIKKYNRNTVYVQYNPAGALHKYIDEVISAMCGLLQKYSTIVVWCNNDNRRKPSQKEKPKPMTTLLDKFNDMRTEMQQFTERTDKYMNSEDNTNKKRIVLYNMSIECSSNLANLIKNRNIISCYLTKQSGRKHNIWNILYGMRSIHVLDIAINSQQLDRSFITFLPNKKNKSHSNTNTARKAYSDTGIHVNRDSINSNSSTNTHTNTNQDKKPLLSAIAYLSLIDRVHNANGIGSIQYIADKATERLDLSYFLWKQLTKRENGLPTMLAHTLVIYTTISKEKKETLLQDKQNQCDNNSATNANNTNTQDIENENTDIPNSESSQSNTNKSNCLVPASECIIHIITNLKNYRYLIFPNLKTLVIYAYKSDRTTIEADIMEQFKVDQQNEQALSQEKEDSSSQKPPKKIELQLQVQIYFIPNSIKADSPELLTPAYIYDDINRPNLECLDYYKYSDGTFTTTAPKETSTTTVTAPIPTETK
ncbi:hypothetical protein ENBRE01_3090 [Enteropsectra breve]|nr:hypothetical protein ENBRE01_3090 [Enteropsectra breve]KAI5181727.1 hypothetical protein NEOKW01_1891 [Nematocida sp. AWRm80]